MTCADARRHLAAWSPRAAGQLDDAVALHLDACPGCRAAFDAAWAPLAVPPDAAADRLVVRAPRARWPAVAVAAAGLLVALVPVVVRSDRPAAARELHECFVFDDPTADAVCEA